MRARAGIQRRTGENRFNRSIKYLRHLMSRYLPIRVYFIFIFFSNVIFSCCTRAQREPTYYYYYYHRHRATAFSGVHIAARAAAVAKQNCKHLRRINNITDGIIGCVRPRATL